MKFRIKKLYNDIYCRLQLQAFEWTMSSADYLQVKQIANYTILAKLTAESEITILHH